MNIYAIPSLVALVFTFILVLYVLFKNPRGPANRAFAMLILSCDVWLLGEFIVASTTDIETAWLWSRLFMSGVMFIPATFLYFTQVFPSHTKLLTRIRHPIVFFLPSFVFLYLVLFTPSIINGVYLDFFGYDQTTGDAYPFFVLYFFVYIFIGLLTLFRRHHKTANPMEKDQIFHVLLGTFIPTTMGGMVDLALPLLDINLPTFGSSMTILMVGVLATGVIKYQLLILEPVYECEIIKGERDYRTYHMVPGQLYLMKKDKSRQGMEVFVDMIAQCTQGMCITKMFPEEVRREYGIMKTPVIDLSREKWNLNQLNLGVRGFVQKAEEGIVLVDDLDYVILHNSLNTVKDFIGQLYSDIKGTKSSVIVTFDPALMDPVNTKEVEDYVASLWVEEVLTTLSNPKRREVLYILDPEKRSFSEIARQMGLSRMPPKLSFHLSGLKEAGMLEQDEEKSYSLTKRGQDGLGIVREVMDTLKAEIEA